MASGEHGVVFPLVDGRRSTSATGRAVVADALRPVDPVGAGAAERETNWRSGYLTHFRRLVEAGLPSYSDARSVAEAGLASVQARMRWSPDGASIAFVSFVGKYPQLFLIPADGGEPRQLTRLDEAVYFLAWQPSP